MLTCVYIFKKLITKKVCVLCVYEKFSKGTGGNRGTFILLCWRLYSDNLFCNETAFYIKVFQVQKKNNWICCQCLKRRKLYISFWSWPAASPFIKAWGSQLSRVPIWFICSCYFLDPADNWVCTHDPDDTLFKVLDCELLTRPGVSNRCSINVHWLGGWIAWWF